MLPSTSAAFLHLPGFINNNSVKGTSNADLPMALLNRNSNPTECQKLGDVAALTTPTSDISSIPRNQTTFYEEPIFVDRFFLSNLITRINLYEQELALLRKEKLVWTLEREALLQKIQRFESEGSQTKKEHPPFSTQVSSSASWPRKQIGADEHLASRLLHEIASVACSSITTSSTTVSSKSYTTLNTPSSPVLLDTSSSCSSSDETTTGLPSRVRSVKRKKSDIKQEGADDSSFESEDNLDFDYLSSDEAFGQTTKRAKFEDTIQNTSHLSNTSRPNNALSLQIPNMESPVRSQSDLLKPLPADFSATRPARNTSSMMANSPRRGHLPERAIKQLKSWFYSHKSHPYPSEDQKTIMMENTGLSRGQINNWFTNARRRLLPKEESS